MTHNTSPKHTESPRKHALCGFVAGAACRGSRLRGDRHETLAILDTMLTFTFVVSLATMVQVSAIPAWDQQTEFEYLTAAETDFTAFGGSVPRAVDGRQAHATLDAGVDCLTRALFVSPAVGSGSLRTTDPTTARISDAVVTSEIGTYRDGSEHAFDIQQFAYRPDYRYLRSGPSLVCEGTVQYTAYAGSEVGATRSLVDGTKVSLVFLEGDIDTMANEATTLGVIPLSADTGYITVTDAGAPITISVPTRLSGDTWRDLLADEPNVRSITYVTGTDSNTLTVELESGKTYSLRLSQVGIGAPGAPQAPAYIVDVEGNNTVVPPGASHRAVVEVRNAQNNPVPSAIVTASPGLTAESGRIVARDTSTVSIVTDSDGRATFVYTTTGGVNGVINDAFDAVVENVAGATIDRVTFDVQLHESGVTDPLHGLVTAADGSGFVYADVGGNDEFNGTNYRVNGTGMGGGVTYGAETDRIVAPPSTGTVVSDRDITFADDGISLHVDTIATGSNSRIDINVGSGSLAAVGMSITSVSGQDITVVTDDKIDLSDASITQGSKASLSIEAGSDIDLDNAGVTVAQDNNSLRIVSTNGFISTRGAGISRKDDIRVDGTDGVDLTGAGLLGVRDNDAFDTASAHDGVNLNGMVMLGDGGIVVDTKGNVFVVGTNIAPTKTDVVIASDGGMASGREAAISAKNDVVITAAARIYLSDFSIEDGDTPELNAPGVEI